MHCSRCGLPTDADTSCRCNRTTAVAQRVPALLWLPVGAFAVTAVVELVIGMSALSGGPYGAVEAAVALLAAVGFGVTAARLPGGRPAARALALVGAGVFAVGSVVAPELRSAGTIMLGLVCAAGAAPLAVAPGLRAYFTPAAPSRPTSIVVARFLLVVYAVSTAVATVVAVVGAIALLSLAAALSGVGGAEGEAISGVGGTGAGLILLVALISAGLTALYVWARRAVDGGRRVARGMVTAAVVGNLLVLVPLSSAGGSTVGIGLGLTLLVDVVLLGALWLPHDARRHFGDAPLPIVEQVRETTVGLARFVAGTQHAAGGAGTVRRPVPAPVGVGVPQHPAGRAPVGLAGVAPASEPVTSPFAAVGTRSVTRIADDDPPTQPIPVVGAVAVPTQRGPGPGDGSPVERPVRDDEPVPTPRSSPGAGVIGAVAVLVLVGGLLLVAVLGLRAGDRSTTAAPQSAAPVPASAPIAMPTAPGQTAVVPMGAGPKSLAVTPDGATVLVALYPQVGPDKGTGSVAVVDARTGQRRATIATDAGLLDLAVTPDGGRALAASSFSDVVDVIDLGSGAVTARVPVGDFPQGLAVAPDGRTAWVANWGGNSVTAIDLTTNAPITTTPVGQGAGDVAVSPDGRTVLVANWDDASVSIIDAARPGSPARTVPVEVDPNAVAFGADGSRAWVTLNPDRADATLVSIDIATGETATVHVTDRLQQMLAAGGGRLVLGLTAMRDRNDGVVEILDVTGRIVTQSIALPDYPEDVAISPDGRTAYVTSNAVNGVLTVVRIA